MALTFVNVLSGPRVQELWFGTGRPGAMFSRVEASLNGLSKKRRQHIRLDCVLLRKPVGLCWGAMRRRVERTTVVVEAAALRAIIFDCDGVILESEDLHRVAYNAAFCHFNVRSFETRSLVQWSEAFYNKLQNKIGGGKPKMRWYFGEHSGWPTSTIFPLPPTTDQEKAQLIDTIQEWKTAHYQELIGRGEVPPRPGVLRVMEEARQAGLLLAVCSAATKSSVEFTLDNLLGRQRFQSLDLFMAGDDVPKKKPDPIIYTLAAQRLGVKPEECVVIEDSTIGLQAALGAGMRCIITYTPATKDEEFQGAERVLAELGDQPPCLSVRDLVTPVLEEGGVVAA